MRVPASPRGRRGLSHRRRAVLAAVALATAAAACGGDDDDPSSGGGDGAAPAVTEASDGSEPQATDADDAPAASEADGAAPEEAEKQTITVAVATIEDQIPDPHLVTGGNKNPVLWTIADQLVRREIDGSVVPGLATEWETSEDGLTWTFSLREGVLFQDGSELDAQDVVTAVERVLEGEDFVPFAQFKQYVTGAEVVDDLTVEIRSSEPYPTLAIDAPAPIPTEYYNEVGDQEFRNKPIGTGPMRFVSQELNTSMTFERFDEFWDESRKPNFQTLVLQIVPEESTRVAGLQTGEIDIAHGITPASAEQLASNDDYQIIEVQGASTAVAGVFDLWTPENETALTDVRVRRALLHAIDREGIANSLYGGYATVPANITTEKTLGNDDSLEPHAYDPELARQLLEEAGYPDLSVTLYTYSATTAIPEVQKLAQAVVGFWQQIGIDAKLDVSDAATYLPNYRSHAYETGVGILGFPSFGYFEPNGYATFYTPTGYYSNLNDPRAAELMDRIATTVDEDERAEAGQEFSRYLYEELPGLPLVRPSQIYAVGPNVASFEPMQNSPYAGPFWYLEAK